MNCKPGELAIVKWDAPYNTEEAKGLRGAIVKTIKFVGDRKVDNGSFIRVLINAWIVECSMFPEAEEIAISDELLRPIRPPEQPVVVGQLEGIKERV